MASTSLKLEKTLSGRSLHYANWKHHININTCIRKVSCLSFICYHAGGMLTCIKSTLTFSTALFCDAHFCQFEKFHLFHKHSLSGHYVLSIVLGIWDKEMNKIQSLTTKSSQSTERILRRTMDNAI